MVEHMSMKAWMVGASVAVMVAALVAWVSRMRPIRGAGRRSDAGGCKSEKASSRRTAPPATALAGSAQSRGHLVHKIYEPNHHADMAFSAQRRPACAPTIGSSGICRRLRARRPPMSSKSFGMRWLQREAGIY